MMGNKLMFHILLFLCSMLLLPVVSVSATSPDPIYPFTKNSSCLHKCGKIDIPFPFGIGADCFLDEWHEILCNNSIPMLKKLGLQVLNISFPRDYFSYDVNAITVNYPITYASSSCSPMQHWMREPLTFYGSPFLLSQDDNIFVAVGCENVAILESSSYSFVGCRTNCTGNASRRYSTCDGYDCCWSTIADDLQEFSVDFRGEKCLGTNGSRNCDCQFAFPVDFSWFENSTDLHAIRDRGYAPVVLGWGILDAAFPTSIGLKPRNYSRSYYSYQTGITTINRTYYYSEAASCSPKSINVNTTTFINCDCGDGFYGNPYIEGGCKDINECEIPRDDGSMPCGGGLRKCRNTQGSYHCSKTTLFIVVGLCSSLGSILLIFMAWCAYRLIKKRREDNLKAKFFKKNGGLILQQQLSSPEGNVEKGRLFNLKELEKATDNFNESRVLGKGGQGTVYKGMLADGKIVAIKKSIAIEEQTAEPFINEVVILSQINHRNVVKLLGWCLESEVPLLVYEFIPNGTLYQYLHDHESPVSWESRLRIATEAAGALFYLHSAASIPIYHRDIKSSNILLDEKYRAKIADFGASRSAALDQTHVTTLVQGTFGYLDPEYFQSSQFTDKSDVYSFGVVLVELLTGQKPVSSLQANEGRSLATNFIISMEESQLLDVLDARIVEQGGADEITAVANLAKRCLNLSGRKRPTMKEVVMELEGIRKPVQLASRIEENQELESNHVEAETSRGADALFARRGFEIDADVISLSDVHPLLPSETW